jgi:hypothetical protein
LSTLLNADDLEESDIEEQPTEKLSLPDAALSIVIGGFVPRSFLCSLKDFMYKNTHYFFSSI